MYLPKKIKKLRNLEKKEGFHQLTGQETDREERLTSWLARAHISQCRTATKCI